MSALIESSGACELMLHPSRLGFDSSRLLIVLDLVVAEYRRPESLSFDFFSIGMAPVNVSEL